MADDRTIYERMVAILAELPAIGKDARNEQQGFMFRSHDAVLNFLNPKLAEHGVVILPDVVQRITDKRTTTKGSTMFEVNLHVRYTFYGAGGDYIQASAWGEGTDMGDKATNKAMTMAFKNVLNQAFAISNEETRDPDADTPDNSPATPPDRPQDPEPPIPQSYAELDALWAAALLDSKWLEQAVTVYKEQHDGSKKGALQMLSTVYVRLMDEGPDTPIGSFSHERIREVFALSLQGVVLEGPPPPTAEEIGALAVAAGLVEGEENIEFGDAP